MLALVSTSRMSLRSWRGRDWRRNVPGKEWPRKTSRQQQQAKAAQQQQQNMLQLAPAHGPRRSRPQKHQRTERSPFARRSADEMKQNRPGHRQRAQQKPWRQEVHADGALRAAANQFAPAGAAAKKIEQRQFQRPVGHDAMKGKAQFAADGLYPFAVLAQSALVDSRAAAGSR